MKHLAHRSLAMCAFFAVIPVTPTHGVSHDQTQAPITSPKQQTEPAKSTATPPADPDLRQQLLQRTKADQEVRQRLIAWLNENQIDKSLPMNGLTVKKAEHYESLLAAVKRTDDDNLHWLKCIIAKHGWPTATLVGVDGAHAAWLIVQHADADPKFQRQCLDLMVKLPKSECSPADIAYLTDRVLLAEGKRQRYGTQFATIDGKLQPRPIDDEARVDERRASLGLPPLAEYAKEMQELFGTASKPGALEDRKGEY